VAGKEEEKDRGSGEQGDSEGVSATKEPDGEDGWPEAPVEEPKDAELSTETHSS
jgi:hypothetical protein